MPAAALRRAVGFADGTSLWPEFVPRQLNPVRALRTRVRKWVSKWSFRRSDVLVVEVASCGRSTGSPVMAADPNRISVVPNTYHQVFDDPDSWQQLTTEPSGSDFTVCYVTRAYPHKK